MKVITCRRSMKDALKSETWQEPFPEEMACECSNRLLPAFVYCDEEGLIMANKPKDLEEGEHWIHDSATFVIYLCPRCFKITTLYTQA